MAVITLSRHFGAGGKTLGTMLAKKLGYIYLDDEIIKLVAEKAQSSDWMDALEKEFGGKLLPCISWLVPKGRIEMILDEKKRRCGRSHLRCDSTTTLAADCR